MTFGSESSKLDNMELGFSKIEGEHSLTADLMAVNPNYDKGEEYQLNCGNCVAAYEMRRKGFDVEAAPRKWMSVDEWEGLFEEFKGYRSANRVSSGVVKEITDGALSWGDGARGMIFGVWEIEKTGHYFSIEVEGGVVKFLEPQSFGSARGYVENMLPSSIIYGRVDNLKPSSGIKAAVIDRRNKS